MKCAKCNSEDIRVRYVPEGEIIDTSYSKSLPHPFKAFLYYSEYDFYYLVKAKKEHLFLQCNTCVYSWREATKEIK